MMYKLSVGHAKIFCDFFASTTDFRQNSAEFPNFLLNRPVFGGQIFKKISRIIGKFGR
jgi:hypothetical protein